MHLVQTMAYANETPWHGLGNKLAANQPIEVWAERAGMNWSIQESEVRYLSGTEESDLPASLHAFPHQKVLYRSDTKAPLSVVSSRYQVVQPAEILEFYRDLTEVGGYELETAGVLKDGKKLWALARTGQSAVLGGNDTVNGYLLLATACDGTLATTAQFTSIRVVCNNTLSIALGDSAGAVKVPHRSQFDAQAVKRQLGVAISSWDGFLVRMQELSKRKVSDRAAADFFRKVFAYPPAQATQAAATGTALFANSNHNLDRGKEGTKERTNDRTNDRAFRAVLELFNGRGRGSTLASAKGTAWGLVNSVTEYVDHQRRARSNDHRLDAAWFGQGAALKQKAWEEALSLV